MIKGVVHAGAADAQGRTVRPDPPNPGPRTSKSDPARTSNCRLRPHHAAHHGGHSVAYESNHLLRVLADFTCNPPITWNLCRHPSLCRVRHLPPVTPPIAAYSMAA